MLSGNGRPCGYPDADRAFCSAVDYDIKDVVDVIFHGDKATDKRDALYELIQYVRGEQFTSMKYQYQDDLDKAITEATNKE